MRYFQQKVEIHWQELVNEMFLASELEKKKKQEEALRFISPMCSVIWFTVFSSQRF